MGRERSIASYIEAFQLEGIFPKELKKYLQLYTFKQGEYICLQGDSLEAVYFLVEGKIKVYTMSPEGKTLILSFLTPIEVLGDIEYIREMEFINTVEAVTETVVIGVHKRWLHRYASDYPPFLQFLLDVITKKFHMKNSAMRFNLLYPVEVRLASYLLSVSFDKSDPFYNIESNHIHLKDVANLIGTSYRHLNRVIQKFSEDDLIERSKGYIYIKDRDGLMKMANHSIYEE